MACHPTFHPLSYFPIPPPPHPQRYNSTRRRIKLSRCTWYIQNRWIRLILNDLRSDLSAAGQCLESVIEALKSCTEGKETRSQNIRVVGASLDASLKYFCDNGGSKLNRESLTVFHRKTLLKLFRFFFFFFYLVPEFFKQGLPQCFIRRPGRHLAKCFPGRITGLASDRHRNNNYWGPIGEDHDFFDAHNCQWVSLFVWFCF